MPVGVNMMVTHVSTCKKDSKSSVTVRAAVGSSSTLAEINSPVPVRSMHLYLSLRVDNVDVVFEANYCEVGEMSCDST